MGKSGIRSAVVPQKENGTPMVGEIKRVRCIGSSLTEENGARALHIYKMSEDRHGGNVGTVGDGVILLVGWLVAAGVGCGRQKGGRSTDGPGGGGV